MSKTCFVVMAIGGQSVGDAQVSAETLKDTYENFLRPAILAADNALEVTRADVVTSQGTITTDILTRLMHSDLVVVDITYPNPNVFYELGMRHACRTGTILVREQTAPSLAPFDVSHQRYIPYEKSVGGIPKLTDQFRERLSWFKANPSTPDNHLLEHAKNSKFNFPQYGAEVTQRQEEGLSEIIEAVVASEGMMGSLIDAIMQQPNVPPMVRPFLETVRNEPQTARSILSGLVKMGVLNPQKLFK